MVQGVLRSADSGRIDRTKIRTASRVSLPFLADFGPGLRSGLGLGLRLGLGVGLGLRPYLDSTPGSGSQPENVNSLTPTKIRHQGLTTLILTTFQGADRRSLIYHQAFLVRAGFNDTAAAKTCQIDKFWGIWI